MFGNAYGALQAFLRSQQSQQYRGYQQANIVKDVRFKHHFDKWFDQYGTVRIEEWPEGLVIWVGGEIVYRSWKS